MRGVKIENWIGWEGCGRKWKRNEGSEEKKKIKNHRARSRVFFRNNHNLNDYRIFEKRLYLILRNKK